MPPRRYTARRRPGMRRRATYRRRRATGYRQRGKSSLGQRFFKHKFTRIEAVGSDEDSDTLRTGIALQQVSALNGTGVAGFDSAARWAAVYKNYEQYAITGMRVRWIPSNTRGGVWSNVSGTLVNGSGDISTAPAPFQLSSQICCFDIDTYDTSQYTIPQICALDRNWCRDPTRSWSKYFSAKGLSKAQQCKWQDTKDYQPGVANGLTNASMAFIQPFKNMGGGGAVDIFGYLKITWYCTFKGQAY